MERASEALCLRLLPVLDALDLATAHLRGQEGQNDAAKALEQIDSLLRDVLAHEGLERIDAVDVPFDPTIHDAVGHVPTDPSTDETPTAGAGCVPGRRRCHGQTAKASAKKTRNRPRHTSSPSPPGRASRCSSAPVTR